MPSKFSRRQYLKSMGALGAVYPLTWSLPEFIKIKEANSIPRDIYIFSKHLQWLDYQAMASTAAQLGFNGVDLTVRPDGHVLPENVVEDLPRAVDAIYKAGLKVELMTTSITSARDPNTAVILKTATKLGIRMYRMGWLDFKTDKPIEAQLDPLKKQLKDLEEINKLYGLHGAYQNHAGTHVGASLWDIWYLIKDLDPTYLGVQFDIRHAMVESANAWTNGLQILAPFIKSSDIKDFTWANKDGKWLVENVPIGQGVVDFKKYFQRLNDLKITGPLCLHLEYPLGGANDGAKNISIPPDQVTKAMKSDLMNLKKLMSTG
ncbi:MAG: sugar phosphate isomerase/epimerase family protein [Saprospiraceae bacterium]|nr:sugar phosphate isomerase/epimerase family protein [Saprospiraceae bacterium]